MGRRRLGDPLPGGPDEVHEAFLPRTELPPAAAPPATPGSAAPDSAPTSESAQPMEPRAVLLAERGLETASVLPAGAVAPAPSRRASRDADRTLRQVRRAQQLRYGGMALAGVLILGLLGWLVFGRGGAPADSGGAASPDRVVLVSLADSTGAGAASALLAAAPDGDRAAGVLIPSYLRVDVAGFGASAFGDALRLPQPGAQAAALADLLGVRVPGQLAFTPAGFAALVDALGGVEATVDVDVLRPEADGRSTILVAAGTRKLDGAQAAQYAAYLAPGEPEQKRLARFKEVLDPVLAALPKGEGAIQSLLAGLGAGAASALAPRDLAEALGSFATATRDDSATFTALPVRAIDAGGTPAYGLDRAATDKLIASALAGARGPTGATATRVLVQNGVGTPGLGESARTRLVDGGLTYVGGGNADRFGYAESVVLISEGSPAARSRADAVAAALGLPPTSVRLTPYGTSLADVVVVLGTDYKG